MGDRDREDIEGTAPLDDLGGRISAIRELARLGTAEAMESAAVFLSDPDETIRFAALRAIGQSGAIGRDYTGPIVIKLLADPEVIVRSEAAEALGLMGFQPAVTHLRSSLLTDPEALVRASAAESLGDLGDPSSADDLDAALDDDDESVRAFAAASLGLLGGSERLPSIRAHVRSETSTAVKAELYAAGYRLGEQGFLGDLLSLLGAADRSSAVSILNAIGDLIVRKSPPTLDSNKESIRDALADLSRRIELLDPEIRSIFHML